MKILVSDYDDTFYTSKYNIKLNVKKIKEFREAGNLFAIATGRGFESIKHAINTYQIPYDYLICMDGLTTFDSEDNILWSKPFNDNENEIINTLISNFSHFKLSSSFTATENDKDILGYSLLSPHYKSIRQFIAEVKEQLPNTYIQEGLLYCYIYKALTNKSVALQQLTNTLQIDKTNVYTIGNDRNDYEMIRDFNGCRMIISHPILFKISSKSYTSVSRLADDIMNNPNKIKEKRKF